MPDTLTENDENVQEEPEVSDTDTTNVSTQDKRKEMPAKISSFISPVKTNEKNSSNKEITSSDLSNWTLTTVNDKELNQIRHSLLPSASGKGRNYVCNVCKKKMKTYTDASEHFLTSPKDCESERQILEDAITARFN